MRIGTLTSAIALLLVLQYPLSATDPLEGVREHGIAITSSLSADTAVASRFAAVRDNAEQRVRYRLGAAGFPLTTAGLATYVVAVAIIPTGPSEYSALVASLCDRVFLEYQLSNRLLAISRDGSVPIAEILSVSLEHMVNATAWMQLHVLHAGETRLEELILRQVETDAINFVNRSLAVSQ